MSTRKVKRKNPSKPIVVGMDVDPEYRVRRTRAENVEDIREFSIKWFKGEAKLLPPRQTLLPILFSKKWLRSTYLSSTHPLDVRAPDIPKKEIVEITQFSRSWVKQIYLEGYSARISNEKKVSQKSRKAAKHQKAQLPQQFREPSLPGKRGQQISRPIQKTDAQIEEERKEKQKREEKRETEAYMRNYPAFSFSGNRKKTERKTIGFKQVPGSTIWTFN